MTAPKSPEPTAEQLAEWNKLADEVVEQAEWGDKREAAMRLVRKTFELEDAGLNMTFVKTRAFVRMAAAVAPLILDDREVQDAIAAEHAKRGRNTICGDCREKEQKQ